MYTVYFFLLLLEINQDQKLLCNPYLGILKIDLDVVCDKYGSVVCIKKKDTYSQSTLKVQAFTRQIPHRYVSPDSRWKQSKKKKCHGTFRFNIFF